MRALAAHGPERIAEVLFDERKLGLNGKLDIGERSSCAAIRRNACENPAAAFLIHQAARAVDGIGDDAPFGFGLACAAGKNDAAAVQAFGDEDNGNAAGDLALKEFDEQRFTDAIDGEDGVALAVVDDRGERVAAAGFEGGDLAPRGPGRTG